MPLATQITSHTPTPYSLARPGSGYRGGPSLKTMWGILIAILIIWAILSVVGFVIEGLLWLAIIGLVLFAVTVLFGAIRGRLNRD